MPKLPMLNAREVIKILNKLGFIFRRQEGSHMFFEHPDGRTTVIPNHPGKDIGRGLLNKIIKHDMKLSREEFEKLLWLMILSAPIPLILLNPIILISGIVAKYVYI